MPERDVELRWLRFSDEAALLGGPCGIYVHLADLLRYLELQGVDRRVIAELARGYEAAAP